MNIIVNQYQYNLLKENQEQDFFKKALFKYWEKETKKNNHAEFEPDVVSYMGYKPKYTSQINEWFIEFMGGWDKMLSKAKKLLDRTFNTNDYNFRGGYNFRFYVDITEDFDEDSYLRVWCRLNNDAEVTLWDGETDLLSKFEEDENIWWEIESEIRELIEDILTKEITSKTGIIIGVTEFLIE